MSKHAGFWLEDSEIYNAAFREHFLARVKDYGYPIAYEAHKVYVKGHTYQNEEGKFVTSAPAEMGVWEKVHHNHIGRHSTQYDPSHPETIIHDPAAMAEKIADTMFRSSSIARVVEASQTYLARPVSILTGSVAQRNFIREVNREIREYVVPHCSPADRSQVSKLLLQTFCEIPALMKENNPEKYGDSKAETSVKKLCGTQDRLY